MGTAHTSRWLDYGLAYGQAQEPCEVAKLTAGPMDTRRVPAILTAMDGGAGGPWGEPPGRG